MESLLYTLNLTLHILAAVGCVGGPFYQLRLVKLRGKLGTSLIYPFDRVLEEILSLQPRLCFGFILVLILTGFAFPLIHFGFHGEWLAASTLSRGALAAKAVLALVGLGIVLHGLWVIDPQVQATFARFEPALDPDDELLNRFWALRARGRRLCQTCFLLGVAILLITPILRFYKGIPLP